MWACSTMGGAPGPVTVTSTVDVPGGAVAISAYGERIVTLNAGDVPKLTEVAPLNPLPDSVTFV